MNVRKLESNLYESFTKVKSDVVRLSNEINKLSRAMTKIVEDNAKNTDRIDVLAIKVTDMNRYFKQYAATCEAGLKAKQQKTKTIVVEKVKKVAAKKKSKTYVASKEGKKFHIPQCIFAKNIKPKSIIKQKSKNAMLNKGYKPCVCVQK